MTYTITKNAQFNSVEILFDGKPSEAIRSALKELKFRWHGVKKVWYGYTDEETVRKAIDGGKVAPAAKAAKKAEAVNKFGVKVGDLFWTSWGYEQTNVDFFQVVAVCGESSVRVREVCPPVIESEMYSHGMAADRKYKVKELPILDPTSHSSFIKDQEKGDIKRLKSFAADGVSNPQFNLSSYANAYLCTGNELTCYESWYY